MTITYTDGKAVEAVLLSRTGNTLRVAIPGVEDVTEFSQLKGAWVTPDCDLATIEFAWQKADRKKYVAETDCVCSHELAAQLLHLLFTDSKEDEMEMQARNESEKAFAAYQLLA